TIHLVAGPIHYDFLLPLTDEARDALAPLSVTGIAIDDSTQAWALIGWGAREFYTTTGGYGDVSLGAIWRSFSGDASVLRVETFGPIARPDQFPALTLSRAQYAQLLAAIRNSFQTDAAGAFQPVPVPGFTATDRFFEAHGRFDVIRTCNIWISRMLRQAGVSFGAWTPTPFAVTLSLKWHS
ncbi:MAG: TIGR02117 family protein, partial [Pseudomonadota bacterium]